MITKVVYSGPHSVLQPVSTLLLFRGVETGIDWPDEDVASLLRKHPDVSIVESVSPAACTAVDSSDDARDESDGVETQTTFIESSHTETRTAHHGDPDAGEQEETTAPYRRHGKGRR